MQSVSRVRTQTHTHIDAYTHVCTYTCILTQHIYSFIRWEYLKSYSSTKGIVLKHCLTNVLVQNSWQQNNGVSLGVGFCDESHLTCPILSCVTDKLCFGLCICFMYTLIWIHVGFSIPFVSSHCNTTLLPCPFLPWPLWKWLMSYFFLMFQYLKNEVRPHQRELRI